MPPRPNTRRTRYLPAMASPIILPEAISHPGRLQVDIGATRPELGSTPCACVRGPLSLGRPGELRQAREQRRDVPLAAEVHDLGRGDRERLHEVGVVVQISTPGF